MLPKKHGFQVCQEMVEKAGSRAPIPIVMHCSIYKSRKYRNDAIKIYGASEYLEDPIEQNVLNEILQRFLEEKPAPVAAPKPAEAAGRNVIPEVVLPPAPPKAAKSKTAGSAMDKALEDTLSGIQFGTKKPRASATADTGSFASAELGKPEKAPPPETKAAEPVMAAPPPPPHHHHHHHHHLLLLPQPDP